MKAADVITEHELYIRKIIHARVWDGFEDDIFQNIALAVLSNFPQFHGESSIKTWLTRVCLNQVAEHFRQQDRWQRGCALMAEQREDAYLPDFCSKLLWEEVLAAATEKQRDILTLALEGCGFHTISEALSLNYEQVRSRYWLFAKKLRRMYTQEEIQ